MGFAAIARVTEDKWVTCTTRDEISFGLKAGDELPINTTICTEVRKKKQAVYIDDVDHDDKFVDHPVPKMYGFKSYVSVPVYRKNGSFFGTLCAIDLNPAKVNRKEVIGMFSLFSELITFHLDAIEELEIINANLAEERHTAEIREQFIAILGHDLRNPIATTRMCSDILLKISKDDMVKRQAGLIKSTSFRMEALIDNILDFARGRLGEGIILNRTKDKKSLEIALKQVIDEIKIISPERPINADFKIDNPVNCDVNRVSQLLMNLLSNADTHGHQDTPIKISAACTNGEFILSVHNKGDKIPEAAKENLFQPFYREDGKPGKQGLGLGLFIASEIALAHDGQLEVTSTEEDTVFLFRMDAN